MARKKKKYALRDVRNAVNQKKYHQANQFFANVRIKRGQEQEAEALKEQIVLGQATEWMSTKNYAHCINFLAGQLSGDYREGVIQKIQLFLGICHFYTADYQAAQRVLLPLLDQPAFAEFRFYYLLSLIYGAETSPNWEELPQVSELPAEKQQFLRVALALKNKDYAQAEAALQQVNAPSRSVTLNQEVLTNLLQKNQFDAPPTSVQKIRPLYRALAQLEITEQEKSYLDGFANVSEQVQEASKQDIPVKIVKRLEDLCNRGVPLKYADLTFCLEQFTTIQPLLVYNQVAALWNQDAEENFATVTRLIESHYRLLIQVPEFIRLYAKVVDFDAEEFRPNHIKNIVRGYLAHFQEVFTEEKATEVSILTRDIFHALFDVSPSDTTVDSFATTYLAYPNFRGLSWVYFSHFLLGPNKVINWNAVDLFNEPLPDSLSTYIKRDFREMLSIIKPNTHSPFDIFSLSSIFDLKKVLANKFIQTFLDLLTEQTPTKNDKTLLSLVDALADYVIEVTKENDQEDRERLNSVLSLYQTYLTYYEEEENATFQIAFHKKTERAADLTADVFAYFTSKENYAEAVVKGIDPLNKLRESGWKLIAEIDHSHFANELEEKAKNLITATHNAMHTIGLSQRNVLQVWKSFTESY